jgi:hypothetical protein
VGTYLCRYSILLFSVGISEHGSGCSSSGVEGVGIGKYTERIAGMSWPERESQEETIRKTGIDF